MISYWTILIKKKWKQGLLKSTFLNPSDFDISSENLDIGELIHPIFMDTIAMNLLSVSRLCDIKIGRIFVVGCQKEIK